MLDKDIAYNHWFNYSDLEEITIKPEGIKKILNNKKLAHCILINDEEKI